MHGATCQEEEEHTATVGGGLPNASEAPPLYAWVVRAPGPAGPTQLEKRGKRKDEETERRTATPAAEPVHPWTLRVTEKKRGCSGVQVVTPRTTTPKNRESK